MFNFLFNPKGEDTMARAKLSKTEKVRNLFNRGSEVSWKSLRNTYDLKSPASMVMKLRNEGMMIYENRSSKAFLTELYSTQSHHYQCRVR